MAKLKVQPAPARGPAGSADAPRLPDAAGPMDPSWPLVTMTGTPWLPPAAAYELLTGNPAHVRLRGWVVTAMGEPDLETLWAAHSHYLIDMAGAYGFAPHAQTGQEPVGDGFEKWRAAFLGAYIY